MRRWVIVYVAVQTQVLSVASACETEGSCAFADRAREGTSTGTEEYDDAVRREVRLPMPSREDRDHVPLASGRAGRREAFEEVTEQIQDLRLSEPTSTTARRVPMVTMT